VFYDLPLKGIFSNMQLSFYVLDKLLFKDITDLVFVQVSFASQSPSFNDEQFISDCELIN